MKILMPVLSVKDHSPHFVDKAVAKGSVVYVLLVLDSSSSRGGFGFKTSDIMKGRVVVDSIKEQVKGKKKLCHDILEWGPTIEKIAQIAEMKQVGEIVVHNPEGELSIHQLVKDMSQSTRIPIRIVEGKEIIPTRN
ncbi:MAG: hypothetical protein Q8P05_01530 [Candidatus Diapherotrites archaeon]|nr:hypothetical protein [Candidatus Diapherotrites archaeon]MDZ4256106.1 hypothetical protein [archaeon]